MTRTRKNKEPEPVPTTSPEVLQILNTLTQLLANQQSPSSSTQPPQSTSTHQDHGGATNAHVPVIRGISPPKLSSPENLSIPQFRDWKQRWTDYSRAQQLQYQPTNTQHGILRSVLDQEWTMLWNSGRIEISPTATLIEIIQALEAYLRSRRNPLLDRQQFLRRDQMCGESVDRYYAALKTLDDAAAYDLDINCSQCATNCYSSCKDRDATYPLEQQLQQVRIRDRLICGLRDKEMQKRVLSEPFNTLTLQQVLNICTAVEISNNTGATLASPFTSENEAAATRAKSNYKKQQTGKQSSSCYRCGLKEYHKNEDCKAKDVKCNYCSRIGHYEKCCLKKKNENTDGNKELEKKTTNPPQENATGSSCQQLITVQTDIASTPHLIKWLPDTGSVVDAISHDDFLKLGNEAATVITPDVEDVIAANGESLGPVGSAKAVLHLNGMEYRTQLSIYKKVNTPLLSKRGCIALGLIPEYWPLSEVRSADAISSGKKIVTTPPPVSDTTTTKEKIMQQFPTAFEDTVLRPMEGPPMKIELIQGATPTKRYKAHTIPFHWRDQVKEQLDSMQKKDVIEPVPVGEALDWCHPMVVVPKKNSSEPRITVDLTGLNKFVRRPAYPVRVPKEVVARVPPGNKYFSTLDARHGYWQVPLDEDSRKLTAFITPWGSYRYKRNVMGLISAGDEHNRRGDEALQGISNVEKIVEDILIYDTDLPTHIQRVKDVIQRCQDYGITLNAKKFIFAQPSVEYCGFLVGPDGYTPAPHLVSALLKFPTPASKTDVRSFCGLVQQFEAFSTKITELMSPIRSLLSAKSEFLWEATHEQAFDEVIKELSSPHVLTHFQPGYPLRLETDAAQSKGLGYALWQQQPDQGWKLLQAGSRFVTPTESRYSASEVEMLAVVWAVKKCRLFLLGQQFELVVDHRPLIPIINSKTLDEIENTRLQRFKEKLSSFRLTAIWRAGTKHTVVDVFSRFPVADPDKEDIEMALDEDPTPYLIAALHDTDDGTRIVDDPLLRGLKESAEMCSEYQRLRSLIMDGFPEKHRLEDDLHPYWRFKDSLTLHEGLIFLGSRMLIPKLLRNSTLKTLHQAHQGEQRTLRRARQAVFWPNITNDIINTVKSCRECQSHLPSLPKEPLQTEPPSQYPFESVGVDLFSYAGYEYLVMVDRFSGWLNIGKCGMSTTTSDITTHLRRWMTDFGIPMKLISDNGPQFSSLEFQTWTDLWRIEHITSSPHYPQSNGLAESAVKSLKYLLEKTSPNGDINALLFQEGLMELRNTPRADGRSPAQLLFGAPTRTKLPLHRSQFLKDWNLRSKSCDEAAHRLRERAKELYDRQAKSLSQLIPGDIVLIQNPVSHRWTTPAEILEMHRGSRSYLIRTESGRVLRRNRRFIRKFQLSTEVSSEGSEAPTESLRRSTRSRQGPQRYAYFVGVSPRSTLEGGHERIDPQHPHGNTASTNKSSVLPFSSEENGEDQQQQEPDEWPFTSVISY